ncbi:hypothetical protein Tco_1424899 [Tanacetum coccineum]
MTTLVKHMIVAGAKNRPLMLDKTIYVELTKQEQLQYDCDVPATNIVLQGLPPDVCIPLSIIFNQLKISEIESSYSCKALNCHIKNVNQVQVNTKFLNALQPKWSKFVTDVKLAKNMYSTNYGQLYAYHSQHEGHANEVRMLRERYPDPLALVANYDFKCVEAEEKSNLKTSL